MLIPVMQARCLLLQHEDEDYGQHGHILIEKIMSCYSSHTHIVPIGFCGSTG